MFHSSHFSMSSKIAVSCGRTNRWVPSCAMNSFNYVESLAGNIVV